MTEDALPNLERAVEAFLAREPLVTPQRIRQLIDQFRALPMCSVSDDDCELLARRFEVRHGVTMWIGPALTERGYEPWLEASAAKIDFYYWERYRRLLESKHLSAQVISTIHADTNRTLGLLENPEREGPWSRKGMVVGHVQSGKTANYVGVVCKAADAGYRLIVVIAGVHNILRNQTQKRVDEGFVGRDSARLLMHREERFIGVGKFDAQRRPVTFTNSVRDFNKQMATGVGVPLSNLAEPALFVVKKNANTLANLCEWLKEHNAAGGGRPIDIPMLLIDDEADHASINVAQDPAETSRINRQIREVLGLFARSCYVGYTATPFANIFIDPDTDDEMLGQDLFPRHFIVSLDPPSNYFGPGRAFGDDTSDFVRHIDDNELQLPIRHSIEHVVTSLPPSLLRAVRTFIVGRAIRIIRGHRTEHCSMLVNASRFTGVQGQLRLAIQRFLEDLLASVRVNGGLDANRALRDPEIAALHDVWQGEFAGAGSSWEAVQCRLLESAAPVKVVEVNSRSHGILNYDDYRASGLSVIAVGGFSLSRGLTLEGLMVSYFLRNSIMYDTLMQMGRWFGYRPEYEDLCRVWMTEEAEGWYVHITESIDQLREELRLMAAAGATPEEFGLKVRAHPDSLIVTARNKMGSAKPVVVSIGLAKQFVETTTLRNDENSLNVNRRAVRELAAALSECGRPTTGAALITAGWHLRDVPVGAVDVFLSRFVNHPLSMLTDPGPIRRYISDRADSELASWDVLFPSLESGEDTIVYDALGIPIRCQRRTAAGGTSKEKIRFSKARVSSRGVERVGVDDDVAREAERAFREEKQGSHDPDKPWNYPDHIFRDRRSRPLLIVHVLCVLQPPTPVPSSELAGAKSGSRVRTPPLHEDPVIAWSISFPDTGKPEQRVVYVVNTTWLREHFRSDFDEEEADGSDA